jgi:hypothetical protein
MPINAKKAALTAVNEAIRMLDYEPLAVVLDVDDEIDEARQILLSVRERLTSKPWPYSLPVPHADPTAYEEWLEARAFEKMQDGRR